jgi:hypothetical protein
VVLFRIGSFASLFFYASLKIIFLRNVPELEVAVILFLFSRFAYRAFISRMRTYVFCPKEYSCTSRIGGGARTRKRNAPWRYSQLANAPKSDHVMQVLLTDRAIYSCLLLRLTNLSPDEAI